MVTKRSHPQSSAELGCSIQEPSSAGEPSKQRCDAAAEHGINTHMYVEMREKQQRKGKQFFSITRNDFVSKESGLQSLPAHPLTIFNRDAPKIDCSHSLPPSSSHWQGPGAPAQPGTGRTEKGAAPGAQHIPAASITAPENKPHRSQGDGNRCRLPARYAPYGVVQKQSGPPTAAPTASVSAAGTLNAA